MGANPPSVPPNYDTLVIVHEVRSEKCLEHVSNASDVYHQYFYIIYNYRDFSYHMTPHVQDINIYHNTCSIQYIKLQ